MKCSIFIPSHVPSVICFPPFFLWVQGAAWASAREAQGPRGHARRDGDDPHRHAGGGSDRPGAVEAAAPPVLQCEPGLMVETDVENKNDNINN